MKKDATHFALKYAEHVNEVLHSYLLPTWFYKHEIYEVPDILTALLITYDNQHDDEFTIRKDVKWQEFLKRMSRVKPDWEHFSLNTMKKFAQKPDKTMLGWEGRTIYFIKGGNHPNYWTHEIAHKDIFVWLIGGVTIWSDLIRQRVEHAKELIPVGVEYFREYEDHVRIVSNFLFIEHLGEAKPQLRTEIEDKGYEVRDLLCQNRGEKGFWKDLKDKYSCAEILFEAKNTDELTRDDLRQTYCYLKPALGLWGFIVCRAKQPSTIHAYNRTLFNNFAQTRGVLILNDDDLRRMVDIKLRKHDPSEYLRDKMS